MITMPMMMLDVFARVGCSSKMFHAHARLILRTPVLAHGLHVDCGWFAHGRGILRIECPRTMRFGYGLQEEGGVCA